MKLFKKTSIFVVSIFTIIFFSCENEPLEGFNLEEENPNTTTNSLIGTWELVNFNNTINSKVEVLGLEIESDIKVDGYDPDYSMTFTENAFTASGGYSYDTEITVSGQAPISSSYTLDDVSGSGTYLVSGNEMTINGSFFELSFQGSDLAQSQGEQTLEYIISADGETLTLKQNTTETVTDNGSTSVAIITSNSTWAKAGNTIDACIEASDFATSAATAYNNDTTNTDLCNAYKSALQNKITETVSATEFYISEYTYDGNKLKTAIFTNTIESSVSMESETYTYENDQLIRIDYESSFSSNSYEEFKYNTSNQLIETIKYDISNNVARKWLYTYNTNETISVQVFIGDLTSQTNLEEEFEQTLINGNITQENSSNSLVNYSFDNMNGAFKSIHQREHLNISFAGGLDANNLIAEIETDYPDDAEMTTYVYNANNYPESSSTTIDGIQSYTTVFTYF